VTLLTAFEIYTNPDDLFISIGGPSGEKNKFSVIISRGPGHNYKPLLTAPEAFKDKKEAMQSTENILRFVIEICGKELQKSGSPAAEILNPENRPIEEAYALNKEHIKEILKNLESSDKAETF